MASREGHTDIIQELLLDGAQVDLQTQVRHINHYLLTTKPVSHIAFTNDGEGKFNHVLIKNYLANKDAHEIETSCVNNN